MAMLLHHPNITFFQKYSLPPSARKPIDDEQNGRPSILFCTVLQVHPPPTLANLYRPTQYTLNLIEDTHTPQATHNDLLHCPCRTFKEK
jgi:hypothetical protein